ncbi:hypothetical protein DV736_g2854, partial [Chaetothyriales sp. CBS 134916]
MANQFTEAFRSFWHAITTSDRHANHDSPFRTGSHMLVSQNRHTPLTSVATSAVDSQHDLSTTYMDETKRASMASIQPSPASPPRPYSPGMRSASSPKVPTVEETAKMERWVEKNYPELLDSLGEGCSRNDVNELEHELDVTLPQDVRESLGIHDGQERGGRPTGIIFGCMLLDCEEIVQEWNQWKVVNMEYLSTAPQPRAHYPLKSLNGGPSTSSTANHQSPGAANKLWRQDLLDRQDSQPPKAVQRAYAHPGWIPLARDWGGNNLAVDLAPGPMGKWGQIIIFGRDYDCKYVVARSWSHFLAIVADDLNSDRVVVDDESGEMKLKEFKTDTIEPGYLDILRWRIDQKYGRRPPGKTRPAPPGLNTNASSGSARGSPYASPVLGEERGRSPHRFSRSGTGSPRHTISSPLARVQEESGQPQPVRPGGDVVKDFATPPESQGNGKQKEKLVDSASPLDTNVKATTKNKLIDVPTPVSASTSRVNLTGSGLRIAGAGSESPEPMPRPQPVRLPSDRGDGLRLTTAEADDGLKDRLAQAKKRDEPAAAVAALEAAIEANGGLKLYQRASVTGQSRQRGGDTSKVLVDWILEVGALSATNALNIPRTTRVRRIDLHSQHAQAIEQVDFMELDPQLPWAGARGYDVVSLSLVVNYVSDPAARGRMLKRTVEFLHPLHPHPHPQKKQNTKAKTASHDDALLLLPALFLVLPRPCIDNSRYLSEDRLVAIMQALGYAQTRVKRSPRLYYSLWTLRTSTTSSDDDDEKRQKAEKKVQ